jgi:hypothetical protein
VDAYTASVVQSFIRLAAKQAYNKGGADDEATHALALFEHATNPHVPAAEREAASRDLDKLARNWMQGKRVLARRVSKHSHPTKSPLPTSSTRGKRHADKKKGTTTEDKIFDAVKRALADGVTSLGRHAEAHRPAMGYGLWRDGQPDRDDLPSVRRIRQLFSDRQTKRDRDTWATVVRLGRKAGHIP